MKPAVADQYITVEDAASELGISTRHVARRAAQGLLRKKTAARLPGEKTARVLYSAADVAALASGQPHRYAVAAPQAPVRVETAMVPEPQPQTESAARLLAAMAGSLDAIERRLAAPAAPALEQPAPAPPDTPWLTLQQAAIASGLPVSWLRRAAAGGLVECINLSPTPGRHVWRFNRASLSDPGAFKPLLYQPPANGKAFKRPRKRS